MHLLPAAFTVGSFLAITCGWGRWGLVALALLWFVDALQRTRGGVEVAALSVVACFVQLWGYGSGFLRAWWGKYVQHKPEFTAFKDNFYD